MSISAVATSSTATVQQRPATGPGKEIREGIDQLKKAVESGDLDAARKAYDSLSKLQDDSGGGDSNNPLSRLLSSVGEALKTGDIAQVQQAVSENGPGKGPRPSGPPPGGPPPGNRRGPSEEARNAMGQLGQSLQSGDVSGAQSALATLTEMLSQEEEDDTGASKTSSSSTARSSASSSPADRLKEQLSQLGSALQSGDVSTAKTLFAALAPRGSQGTDILA